MDKPRAVKLLEDTFRNDFNIDQYSIFIKELFNDINIVIQDKTASVASQFKEYISECKKIGEYRDKKKSTIEILCVKLKKTSSRDRARTMQRNFISGWLGNQMSEAALVAFHGDDPQDWRFSFVKMEYNLIKDEDGKVKNVKELTPAKRYSFLVGINEPNHTCQSQFLELIREEKTNPSIAEIEQAFSIEKVTKEFFEKYKELAIDLRESLDKIVETNSRIKTEFDSKSIKTIDFSKKLLGQIVFIYFLQKKGWLGVQKRPDGTYEDWGTGPRNFLRKLYNEDIAPNYENFFNDRLEPLFYSALANDRSADNDYFDTFKCKIPFLNGGLFEPLNEYDWTGTDVKIPNEIIKKIFDTFDLFNFTVKEDEPLEKEVAVDPEMLGKVFENLLDVKDRKDKGAFYTPREIVHYMCQQSLINYLETNTENVPKEDIERFIQYGDLTLNQIIKSLAQKENYNGKSYVEEKFLIPKSIVDNYQIVDNLLRDIKVVDPAVGSGAFPVGMMNEIVKARSILTNYFKLEECKARTEYNLKRHCIENSLYGVDLEPSAVEIAKLRFWLSLIVDEEKKENIQPLPNLDYKIMCGNSLLEEFEGVKLFDEKMLGKQKRSKQDEINELDAKIEELRKQLVLIKNLKEKKNIEAKIRKLKQERIFTDTKKEGDQISISEAESEKKIKQHIALQNRFFNEQDRNKKKTLRDNMDRIEWELIETTLREQGKFETINRIDRKNRAKPFFLWKLNFAEVFQRENPGFDVVIANPPYVQIKQISQEYKKIYENVYEFTNGRFNIFYLFIELSGKRLTRKYGISSFIVPDRLLLNTQCSNLRAWLLKQQTILEMDSFKEGVFESAVVDNILMFFKNDMKIYEYLNIKNKIEPYELNLRKSKLVPITSFIESPNMQFDLGYNPKRFMLTRKIREQSIKLGEISDIRDGIIQSKIPDVLFLKKPVDQDSKKLLFGKDVNRYTIHFNNNWVNYKPDAMMKIELQRGGGGLRLRKKEIFERNKILTRQTADKIIGAFDINEYYYSNTLHGTTITDKEFSPFFILANLNSSLINWYYKNTTAEGGKVFAQVKIEILNLLPIKKATEIQQKPFVQLVD
ncbi:MAG: TaqI-like C-terminal specificity domain-containing protein, partial [Thermoplasmata archaeon]|nr:TaqI-like C-terminal specificity domain-containing protein [Thermoplasmata archaeon]